MSAQRFLELLRERSKVDKKQLQELRQQPQLASGEWSANELAMWLAREPNVNLNEEEALSLLQELALDESARDASQAEPGSADPAPKAAKGDNAAAGSADPESEIARLEQELAECQDRVVRVQAELENYRKRVRRDREQDARFAEQALLADLLPVIDNLNRAIQSAEGAGGTEGLLEGVKMVAEQLHGVLDAHHCRPIEAQGAEFDHNYHAAIQEMTSEEHPPGTVALVAQTGYTLHDRVLRPAQVIVSTGPPESGE